GTNANVVLQEAPPRKDEGGRMKDGSANGYSAASRSQALLGNVRREAPLRGSASGTSGGGEAELRGLGFRAELGNQDEGCSTSSFLVPLSARSPQALRALAGAWKQFLDGCPKEICLHDLAYNAAQRRSHHDHRLAVVAHSRKELDEQLAAFAAGLSVPCASTDRLTEGQRPRLAFVCSGQGPQWWAMGRQLLEQEPVFRAVIERCDEIVSQLSPWSLFDELTADEAHSRMAVTAISQPAIFAL